MEQEINKYKAALKKAVSKIEELSDTIKEQKHKEDIAIIGYSCRFPGDACHSEGFWDILSNGRDTVTEIKKDRFDYREYYSDNNDDTGKMNVKNASYLKGDIKKFDNIHFALSAVEAGSIDPQHRLLLEVSWEALENSALHIERIKGSRTGVFIGINSYEYSNAELFSGDASDITPYTTAGVSLSSAAGRLSYFYDFVGPAITCDTACSSSLVALNMAVDSLRNNQCDMAIVGGSNLLLLPESFIGLSRFNGLSKDGICKTFDDSADGFGRGEGCGVVILKRLSDAETSDNDIVALVKGVAIGQDGKSNGFTAPNGISQQRVIKQALDHANLTVNDIDYIETHGAGTSLGDLIEVQSLAEVFEGKEGPILIGSVKPNIGHLEGAAGIASLIKVIMAIENKQIPPNIHFNKPNQKINWDKAKVVETLTAWNKPNGIRRAGISSFGFSGTLAHAIIEEPPAKKDEVNLDLLSAYIMNISGKNENALKDYLRNIKEYLLQGKYGIEDITYTTNISRSFLNYRSSIVGESIEDFIVKIDQILEEENNGNLCNVSKQDEPKIAFLFTGQGSIYKNIAKDLYITSKPFREMLDLCCEKFYAALGISIIDAIYGDNTELINTPLYSQPIIFSIEYALTQLWNVLGIKPEVVIGHSIGEYVAACYAGLINFEDAVLMIAQRGKMMESIVMEGKMLGILTNVENVKEAIAECGCKNVSIAAINAPENVTISGMSKEVDKVVAVLQAKHRVFVNKLNIPHPYHSSMMKDYEDAYSKNIGEIKFSHNYVDMISSISGRSENEEVLGTKEYWVEHLSNTVNYQSAILEAKKRGVDTFIEIGGDATLSGLANQCITDEGIQFLPSLRKGVGNYLQLFDSISTLFLKGININWNLFYKTYRKNRVKIPNYPFQRKKLWKEVKVLTDNSLKQKRVVLSNDKDIQDVGNKEKISLEIKEMIKILTRLKIDEIEDDLNLLMMGFDSLILVSLNKQISSKYNVTISLNEFFTNLDTVDKIAGYIVTQCSINMKKATFCAEECLPVNQVQKSNDTTSETVEVDYSLDSLGSIQNIFKDQIQIISDQLKIINNITNQGKGQASNCNHSIITPKTKDKEPDEINKSYYVPYKELNLTEKEQLDGLKLKYVRSVEKKYINYSSNSKETTQRYRNVYANNRNIAGFRPLLKEMIYQIIAEKGNGSKLVDIDGNHLIDLTMGFGVNMFGHNPSFVNKALVEELNNGMPLGPMGRLSGMVAKQISELTGVERVAFYNSGTEANMVAVRVARAITGKKKIVTFAGSYHGTYDGLLGLPTYDQEGKNTTIPLAPGILESVVTDLIILDYESDMSLEFIRENSNDIAGILVETVQSRKPDVQPKDFLKKLRMITEEKDIALIFDEIITGFRIAAGGAQQYFGIQADIVTYGKVVGGGMPIGIVAGKAKYLDSIDGGMWKYGDDSVPPCEKKRTFVAGTFSHHPLAMASTSATLSYIKENKDTLYRTLNEKSNAFVSRVNAFFIEENIPMKVVNFGSLFRFVFQGDFEIFFYGLLEKGIYIWEGRNCFFSTEHTDNDMEVIISAIKITIKEMSKAGYFGRTEGIKNVEQYLPSIFPMSIIQQRLYAQSTISKDDPNTIVSILSFEGKVNNQKMEMVIQEIIKRHESLRTRLYIEEGEFKQEVLNTIDFKIIIDRKEPQETLDHAIARLMTSFDLGCAPLVKVILLYTEDDRGILMFNFHHTIADGISMNIFVQECIQLYAKGSLLSVNKQYRDFVEWEKEYVHSDEIKYDEAYWNDKLSGEPNALNLPLDYPIDSKVSLLANCVYLKLDFEKVEKVNAAARQNKCSSYMLLVAAFNLLLKKLSGNDDISIITPITNRVDGTFDESIGMFTNTMVLRNHPKDERTFKEFLDSVKENCVEAYAHMYYPFNFLMQNIKESFNVMFIYEKVDQRILNIEGLELRAQPYKAPYTDFDLTLEILEESGSYNISLIYKINRFQEATIRRWAEYFKNILALVSEKDNMDSRLKDIEIIGDDEKKELLYGFNPTESHELQNKSMCQLFEEQVERTPDKPAVICLGKKLSYKELNERSNQLAGLLRKMGVESDIIVGIMVERSFEMIIGIMAILKAGGAYLPIDPEFPKDRIRYMLANSECNILITQRSLYETFDFSIHPIYIEDAHIFKGDKENIAIDISADQLAYVIYTSGSTGNPKGVMIEHRNLTSFIKATTDQIEFQESESILCLTTISFDIFGLELFIPISKGMVIYLATNREQKDLLNLKNIIYENSIEILQVTPSRAKSLIESVINDGSKKNCLKSLKTILIGGEELPFKVYEELRAFTKAKIYNMYGPTEATIWATIKELSDNEPITIGKSLSNCRVLILEDGKLQPIGVSGELYISGEAVGRGYVNEIELTREKFTQNPFLLNERMYRTGDLARWQANGNIQFLGRIDNQVKIRGHRIELGEIEHQILKKEGIKAAVVIDRKDVQGEKYLCAYIVSDMGLTVPELRMHISRDLPEYMVPSYFIQLEKLPQTPNGKVDRKALPEPNGEIDTGVDYEAPGNEIEELFVDLWKETLGSNKIGVYDDFFNLGGDSIKAIQLVSRIQAKRYIFDVETLYNNPTIRQLVRHVEDNSINIRQMPITGEIYQTPVQRWFLKEQNMNQDLWNQTIILYKEDEIDVDILKRVFSKIVIHHDALRMVCKHENGMVIQWNRDVEESLYDIEICGDLSQKEILEKCDEIQKSINIESGPLVKLGLFKTKLKDYLFIAIHGLVIDDISWKILLEDLETGYSQAERGQQIVLNEKTTSFKDWANKLNAYENSYEAAKLKNHWNSMSKITVKKLPNDKISSRKKQ